jgi:hypothetical protein
MPQLNRPVIRWKAVAILGFWTLVGANAQDEKPVPQENSPAQHMAWKDIPISNDRLPWAIYDPKTMTLDGKNLTPGFEALATRFGKVALRFAEQDDKIPLLLNKKPIRYQPMDVVELGSRGHFAYVRAADDRLMLRIGLLIDWLRKNKEKAATAIGKQAMAEFEDLYAKHDEQAKLGRGRKNELAELELDFFLFQYLEGRPALSPIPGTKTTLAAYWERELWCHQTGRARFNPNLKKDQEFLEFHCQKFTGAEGSPFRGKPRNPPPSQLGDPEIPDR